MKCYMGVELVCVCDSTVDIFAIECFQEMEKKRIKVLEQSYFN